LSGLFVVVEGLDGAGTTTQSARLVAAIQALGREVVATREPTSGPVGRLIRQSLRGDPDAPAVETLPWLFAADRADHLHRLVRPALARGAVVVSDRYVPSSLAYQSLTMPIERVAELNADFPAPDLTIFLDVPADVGLARVRAREGVREIYEDDGPLAAVARAYRAALDWLRARGDRLAVLDGTAPPDVVAAAAWDALRSHPRWPSS
jgi:dTMP kinase